MRISRLGTDGSLTVIASLSEMGPAGAIATGRANDLGWVSPG